MKGEMTMKCKIGSQRLSALTLAVGIFIYSGANASQTIVCIGDSNFGAPGVSRSEAYPAQLEAALRAKGLDVTVINAGKNGDTTQGVISRMDSDVPNGTSLAIVSVGINDVVLNHDSTGAATARVDQIAQHLKSRGIKVIVLPTGKDFQGSIAGDPKYHVEANGQTDVHGPAPGTTKWHLTGPGYAIVVARTLPQVVAALKSAK
jgi:acyl-CoA thioesterase-1